MVKRVKILAFLIAFLTSSGLAQTVITAEQCVGDPISGQGAGVAVAGLILNNLCLVNATSSPRNYKIATLYPDGASDADHLHLLVTLGGWLSSTNSYVDAVFANRGGFSFQYTVRGAPVTAAATMAAYRNSDASVDIYLTLGANSYSVAGYSIVENAQETVYSSPTYIQTAPTGTLVFDASNPGYPPVGYTDFLGNQTIRGNLNLSGGGASIHFPDGTTQSTAWSGTLCGGDYAESVDVSDDRLQYEPGDVIVINANEPGKFLKSAEAYSTAIAGIYSTKPGLVGRRQTADPKTSTTEIPMAMVGVVPTKVSAENGPIRPGDLLVTLSTLGHAMKGTDRGLLVGAIVGKALGALDSGTGVIEVLVSLQ